MNDNDELDNELLERETARITLEMSMADNEEQFLQEQFAGFDVDFFRGLDLDDYTKTDYVRELIYNKMVIYRKRR
jgi:hypothetical protein